MNFRDIPAEALNIRVKRADNSVVKLEEQPVLSVDAILTRQNEFELRLEGSVLPVKPVVDNDTRRLGSALASGRTILAQLANPAVDGSAELQIVFFAGELLEMGDVEIGVDEFVEKGMARIRQSKNEFKGVRLYQELEQLCCLDHCGSAFFFLTAGPAIDRELKAEAEHEKEASAVAENIESAGEGEEIEDSLETDVLGTPSDAPKPEPTRKNSFCVTGHGIRFVVTETGVPYGEPIFTITRLTKFKDKSDRALRLAKGKLRFVDFTDAEEIQLRTRAQMIELTKDESSYLKKWDWYGDREGKLLLARARKIGALQYSHMSPNRDGTVSVKIDNASDSAWNSLRKGEIREVDAVDDLPDYLKNPELEFAEFVSRIGQFADAENLPGKHRQQRKESKVRLQISCFDPVSKSLNIKTDSLPPSGILISSLAGDVAQIKRRVAARFAILTGRDANGQLGPLIEEHGKITRIRPPQKIKALTAFVRKKVFENRPTPKQEEAIEVALNTPDIALIQGPPGTGKTTVIAAILERLNEMADKSGANGKGRVLLTGFQHDAVENMINRISLNGIPVPKFGRRSGAAEDDFDAFERSLEDWCGELAAKLRAKNPQIGEIQQEQEIKNLRLQYLQAPTRTLAVNLVKKISNLGSGILGEELSFRAGRIAKKLSFQENLNAGSNPLVDTVRRLRTRLESFTDDGPDRAADALDDLKDVLEEDERDILDRASLWRREDGVPSFLNTLDALKEKLLIDFTAPPVFRVEKYVDEVISISEEAIKKIKVAGFSARDAKSAALAEFLDELESNPYGMIDAVSDYSYAFAATCQQSVNREMQKKKGITGNNAGESMEYDYVIVDEAARVSPRDIMIAMAQGRRIILVGDHRQLPHIVDEAVIEELSDEEKDKLLEEEKEITERDKSKWLNLSLFEYLFTTRLPVLEKQDRFPRRVTLDAQYRMHPTLGEFVSRNFYERFDRSEKFRSGRPASDFAHDLSGTGGKPAVWLEVPFGKGPNQSSGHSWYRSAEAIAIAQQLKTWIHSEAGKNLSFGVISFYKAQAELIRNKLQGITEDDAKLRVGTVDSFQGMEFDVVFLSTVRTVSPEWRLKDSDRHKQARGLFGHLCLYNRLNVALSRQRKLLVLAGDPGLLQNELAEEFIPGLVDFLKLCQTEGEILKCR
jgi:hypothetical protein